MDRRRLGKLWAFIAAMLFVVGLFPMHAFCRRQEYADTGSHTVVSFGTTPMTKMAFV
jgi:hypothetical protein